MRNYDETSGDFRWPAPESFNFATDVVDRWAEDVDLVAMIRRLELRGREAKRKAG